MTSKKIIAITASIVIPIAVFGTLILAYPPQTTVMPNEPFPFEMWSFEYDDTIESFPTESLGQKICDITYRCEVPIQINVGFLEDSINTPGLSKSDFETSYDRKITNNTISMNIIGSWNDKDRLEIKQFIEEIPSVSDLQFDRDFMP